MATRSTMTGTYQVRFNAGPLAALPATGREVAVPHMHFFRYREGRVVDMWHVWDTLKRMQQLGVPAPDLGRQRGLIGPATSIPRARSAQRTMHRPDSA